MTWFAFHGYPDMDVAGVQEKELTALGFHGYATKAQADAHPNSVGFWQKPTLNLMEKDYSFAVAAGEQPGGPNSNLANPANDVKGVAQAVGKATGITSYLDAIKKVYGWITGPPGHPRGNIVRVVKVVTGGTMILVGISMLAEKTNTVQGAISTAAKVVK
jgi:hypothetical protein